MTPLSPERVRDVAVLHIFIKIIHKKQYNLFLKAFILTIILLTVKTNRSF